MARIRSRRRVKKLEDSFPVGTGDPSPLVEMPAYDQNFIVDSGAAEAFTDVRDDSTPYKWQPKELSYELLEKVCWRWGCGM